MSDESTTAPAAEPFAFPFTVPADLATATDQELVDLHGHISQHVTQYAGLSPAETTPATIDALRAYRDLARAVTAESTSRRGRAAEAGDLASDLSAELNAFAAPGEGPDAGTPDGDPDGQGEEPDGDGDPDPADDDGTDGDGGAPTTAVTAARRGPARRAGPRVRDVARGARAPQVPGDGRIGGTAQLVASADFAGFSTGQRLNGLSDAARILSRRLDQYPTQTARRTSASYDPRRRPLEVYTGEGRRLVMKNFSRHAGVQIRREFPENLRVQESGPEGHGYAVAMFAASERRLPGGSLIESMRQQFAKDPRKSLTAAAGWCAPSDVIYDLMELETVEGVLDAPELQTDRGGWQIPIDGGPNFTTIYTSLGNSGDTHLTEAEVIADTSKVCTDIPCPEFEDIRLGVDYYCLTGSLLQRRGYPEVVARWARAAQTALVHKINQGFIAAIVAESGNEIIIPADPSGDDAVSHLLWSVELAIEDIKYLNRMGFGTTVEIVLPHWVIPLMRAALSRRSGVAAYNVTNAQILDAFTTRGAVPRFVYDWQDGFSGLATGPGNTTPRTSLPETVQFLAYPSGTFVRAVQSVVELDTVYDSTKLTTNEYTAVFVEDGWAALKMGPTSRLYTARVDPSGVVGCCPDLEVS